MLARLARRVQPHVGRRRPYSDVQTTLLANGLRVVSQKLELPTATVGMWIDTGSRFETANNNGAAHFVEHMTFKGTPSRSQKDIELEFEHMGGHLNAYTSREQTCYNAKVLSRDLPAALAILGDILQNSSLDAAALERERSVILREQEEVNKNMEEVIMEHLHAVAFQGTPLARTILGTEHNIRTLSRRDLAAYLRDNYAAQRMVLVAAGGVDHADLVSRAQMVFGRLPAQTSIMRPEPGRYTGAEVRVRDDDMEAAHIVIAFRGASFASPDYFPLLIAQAVVGNWSRTLVDGYHVASPLAQAVASLDLAHSFMSFNTAYTDTGLWGIYLISDRRQQLAQLVRLVLVEWARLAVALTESEIVRAKSQIKATMMLSLDGTMAIADDIGRQMLVFGRHYSLQEMFAMVDAISLDAVKDVCRRYLYDQPPALAAFGPIASCPNYSSIRVSSMAL